MHLLKPEPGFVCMARAFPAQVLLPGFQPQSPLRPGRELTLHDAASSPRSIWICRQGKHKAWISNTYWTASGQRYAYTQWQIELKNLQHPQWCLTWTHSAGESFSETSLPLAEWLMEELAQTKALQGLASNNISLQIGLKAESLVHSQRQHHKNMP